MSFRHKSSLSRHNKIHLKVTQCKLCNRSFRYESFLKKHLQTAHKGSEIAYVAEQVVPKGERAYIESIVEIEKEELDEKSCISVITYEHDQPPQMIQVEASSHFYVQPMSITISSVDQSYAS